MKKVLIIVMLLMSFLVVQKSISFAEYGLTPLDNQIEQIVFNDGDPSGYADPNFCVYESVAIEGSTLIVNLTIKGYRLYSQYLNGTNTNSTDVVGYAKHRVNQLYESAGSNKRIKHVMAFYNGTRVIKHTYNTEKTERTEKTQEIKYGLDLMEMHDSNREKEKYQLKLK